MLVLFPTPPFPMPETPSAKKTNTQLIKLRWCRRRVIMQCDTRRERPRVNKRKEALKGKGLNPRPPPSPAPSPSPAHSPPETTSSRPHNY